MKIRPIRDEEDYEAALRRIARLMESEPAEGTDDLDDLEVLVTLVESYEREHYDPGPAGAVETIKFHLDRLGWTQTELARRAGIQASHLSAVLNGRRELSLTQIKKLSALFELPPGHFLGDASLDGASALHG
ncbi:MAG: helix-turn-helix domain-containing protein [Bradymonadaceae bacterium]